MDARRLAPRWQHEGNRMRLCRFDEDRLGVVISGKVHDVSAAQEEIRRSARYDMKGDAVIAALPAWRKRLEDMAKQAAARPLSEVRLVAPVARPSKLMAAPTNYRKHIEEMAANRGAGERSHSSNIGEAGIFLKANSSLVGPSEGVPLRFPDRRNDHEAEIAIIIGKQGTNIPRDQALDYVAGYSLGLDMTVRGQEDRSFRKSVDGYSVLGPWIVTADEIPDPNHLAFKLELNGQTKQNSNTEYMVYDIPRLIEFASSFYTLYPGDVFFTGTPEGVGPVRPGDSIEVSCEKIGALTTKVRAHAAS
jgi:2-keto-4-pentenoate hydratase/2-oxohepta-3-ene-1,7-dioic acid hydratase in catechol pathway